MRLLLRGNSGKLHREKTENIVVGLSSRVCGGHVIFLDMDWSWLPDLKLRLSLLQKRMNLSHFYIVRSSRGHYHAVCFQVIPFSRFLHIMRHIGDKLYYNFTKKAGFATLRISRKLKKKSSGLKLICKLEGNEMENTELREEYMSLLGFENA